MDEWNEDETELTRDQALEMWRRGTSVNLTISGDGWLMVQSESRQIGITSDRITQS